MCDCDIDPILCGGCGLIIREFEEGVWVRGGSDECEAGGVHAPPSKPSPLTEIYMIREKTKGWWLDRTRQVHWTPSLEEAAVYYMEDDSLLPANSEWVRFSVSPF